MQLRAGLAQAGSALTERDGHCVNSAKSRAMLSALSLIRSGGQARRKTPDTIRERFHSDAVRRPIRQ